MKGCLVPVTRCYAPSLPRRARPCGTATAGCGGSSFFGGSDLSNETAKALEAIHQMNRSDITVDVVVGVSNPRGDQIREICQGMPNTCFHLQVENMAELIALADLAIGAGGTTTWERCCLGLPTLALVLADNQREVVEVMSAAGAMMNVGWHADVTSTGLAEA